RSIRNIRRRCWSSARYIFSAWRRFRRVHRELPRRKRRARDCRATRRQCSRDAPPRPAWALWEPRRTNLFHGELAGGAASGICRSRRGCICGTNLGIRDRNRFQGVKNEAAAFAAENFFVGFRSQFLKNVWQDAHAAAAALPVASFGHSRAIVALGDARVKFAQIFRYWRNDFFAFDGSGI